MADLQQGNGNRKNTITECLQAGSFFQDAFSRLFAWSRKYRY
ncbi:MAG TPA: hypothetical protein VNW49_07130 [Puia sp.]|nr:hypothetical protein [Puia sp.]